MSNVDIHGQARSQTQAHELSGPLTSCEDAQNRRRHPDRSRTEKIVSVSQTVLSTAKPLSTCNYTSNNGRWMRGLEILPAAHARTHTHKHTALSEVHRSVVGAEHRQTTHEHMSNVDINGQARSQTQAHELSGSLTPCEDAQGKRRHPDRSRTKKSSVFLKRR